MNINLLDLSSSQEQFYLIKLLSSHPKMRYYVPNRTYSLSGVAASSVEEAIPQPHVTSPTQSEPRAWSFWSVLPSNLSAIASSFVSPAQQPRLRPHTSASISSPEATEVELSHFLLVLRKDNQFCCYVIENTPFSEGSFGRVYKCPRTITVSLQNMQVNIFDTPNIAKQINVSSNCVEHHQMVINEFTHLKSVDRGAELIRLDFSSAKSSKTLAEYWLITREIKGATLDKLDLTLLSLESKFKIALSLLKALQGLHDTAGYGGAHIHNDIKPPNIIVDDKHMAHIIDYGLATAPEEIVTGGTLAYMAPEFYGYHERATRANDVHALGVVLFQLFLEIDKPFSALPKGRVRSVQTQYQKFNNSNKDIGFQSVKVFRGTADKFKHRFNFGDPSVAMDPKITGLKNKDASLIFAQLKRMRHNNPLKRPDAAESYEFFYEFSRKIPGFNFNEDNLVEQINDDEVGIPGIF